MSVFFDSFVVGRQRELSQFQLVCNFDTLYFFTDTKSKTGNNQAGGCKFLGHFKLHLRDSNVFQHHNTVQLRFQHTK